MNSTTGKTKPTLKPFNDGTCSTDDGDNNSPTIIITHQPNDDSDSYMCFPCAGDKR